MRKYLAIALAIVMALTTFTYVAKAEDEVFDGYKLGESDFQVVVGGKEVPELKLVQVQFYDKSGEKPQLIMWNVMKIRDLAEVLKDTEKKFGITYDKETRTVTLTSGADYVSNGTELKELAENPKIEAQSFKFMVNGEEKEIMGVVINGENYVLTSKLVAALGNLRFHSYPGDKAINYIDFEQTDIEAFNKEKFDESVKAHDYTIVYSWGPWCPWSRRSVPFMVKLSEKLAAEGKNVQIYGVVNKYKDYSNKDLAHLFEGKEVPWTEVGGTKEGYEYLNKLLALDENSIFYFPTMFILDKDGKKVGKTFGQMWDVVENEYIEKHNIPKDGEITDEQFNEYYPTIYDAFISQIEPKAEEKKEEVKAEEKKEDKKEDKKEEKKEEKKDDKKDEKKEDKTK